MAADGVGKRRGTARVGTAKTRSSVTRRVRRPKRRRNRWLGLLLVLLFAGAGAWLYRSGLVDREALRRIPLPGLQPPKTRPVTLYFADPRWTRLVAEERDVQTEAGSTVTTATALVEELARGSQQGHAPVLPSDARLRGAYVGKDGLLVLDFEPALRTFDPGGASGEALTIFSLVNTMSENIQGVRQVQLMVGGEEQETLAGHVKISEPLQPDSQWLVERPRQDN